jgi:hypothetical protein
MNKALSNIQLIDGTQSVQSYIVAQKKKAAILAIKPEVHVRPGQLVYLFRIRMVADPGSLQGITNHKEYIEKIYAGTPFTKLDSVRGTYYLTVPINYKTVQAFGYAENGKLAYRRLLYKMILQALSAIQVTSGAPIEETGVVAEWLLDQFMKDTVQIVSFDEAAVGNLMEIEEPHKIFNLEHLPS